LEHGILIFARSQGSVHSGASGFTLLSVTPLDFLFEPIMATPANASHTKVDDAQVDPNTGLPLYG
jgi:hypothetical protein